MAYMQLAALFTAGALVVVGLFAAIFIDNIVKKIIGISFIEEGANLFIIAIGYKPGGVVPILMPGMSPSWYAANSAYPLPFWIGTYKHCNRCKYTGSNVGYCDGYLQKKIRNFKYKSTIGRHI